MKYFIETFKLLISGAVKLTKVNILICTIINRYDKYFEVKIFIDFLPEQY